MTTATKKMYDEQKPPSLTGIKTVPLTPKWEREWDKTRAKFLSVCPAFAHIWYTMMVKKGTDTLATFVETDAFPVAATDGKNMILRPGPFFDDFDLNERIFILAHEIMHCVYDHCGLGYAYRKRGEVAYSDGKKLPYIHQYMNMATDYVINALLKECGTGKVLTKFPLCLDDKYSAKGEEAAVDVYRKLFKDKPPKVVSFDELLEPGAGDEQDPQEAQSQREEIEWKTAVQAGMAAAKAQGKLPAGLERAFGEILEPQVSWQEHITSLLARKVGGGGYDYRRADRRLIARDIYAPGRSGFGTNMVVVGVDMSGSIGEKEIAHFMGELGGILEDVKPKRCIVMWCDAAVAGVDEVEEPADIAGLKPKGGGGTDMGAIFKEVDRMGLEPDCTVVLTDGYTPFPSEAPKYPVVWASTAVKPDGYPFGDVVEIQV